MLLLQLLRGDSASADRGTKAVISYLTTANTLIAERLVRFTDLLPFNVQPKRNYLRFWYTNIRVIIP